MRVGRWASIYSYIRRITLFSPRKRGGAEKGKPTTEVQRHGERQYLRKFPSSICVFNLICSLHIRYTEFHDGANKYHQSRATGNRCVRVFRKFATLCLISQPREWGANGEV